MNYKKLYAAVKDEYSDDIALSVCIAYSIHMQTEIEEEDLTESGRYHKRIEEQIRYVLWENNDDIDLIIDLESRVYTWLVFQEMDFVLDDRTPKLFKDIKGSSSVNAID